MIREGGAKGNDDARHFLFVRAKRDLEMLPPTHGALEVHITRTNYQAKIWLQADYVIMDLESRQRNYWLARRYKRTKSCLEALA